MDRDGELFSATAGQLDSAAKVPMPADAIFNIASMTKPVTSVAIMMLLDQGKLALDDPVSKYLPGFDNLQVITKFNEADGTYETRPGQARDDDPASAHAHVGHRLCVLAAPSFTRLQQGTQKSEWELPLLNDPGDKWNYSASTRVLGLVVEKITGVPLEDYYQEHIFKPLGMKDTSYARASGETVARRHRCNGAWTARFEQQPRATIARHTAAAVPRRWRAVFHCAGLRAVHPHAAEWRQARRRRAS